MQTQNYMGIITERANSEIIEYAIEENALFVSGNLEVIERKIEKISEILGALANSLTERDMQKLMQTVNTGLTVV